MIEKNNQSCILLVKSCPKVFFLICSIQVLFFFFWHHNGSTCDKGELFIEQNIIKKFKLGFTHIRGFLQVIIGCYSGVNTVLLLLLSIHFLLTLKYLQCQKN